MRVLTCSQLRKCLSTSPPKSLKLYLRVPLYSLFPHVPNPISHLGWQCLLLHLPFSSFCPYHQHKHREYSLLELWEIRKGKVFPFLFYHPLNPSAAEVHIKPCYPRCCSPDTLNTSQAALAHSSWQPNWCCDTAQPTHEKGAKPIFICK